MIVKSSQRSAARELAGHLTKATDIDGHPQTVRITSSRYVLHEDDVRASLQDMEIMSKVAPRCQKHLYHISVSPEQPMSDSQWNRFWEVYETEFGLQNLAYIEVTHDHLAHDRPPHKHRVYERVDTTSEKAIQLSWTKIRNEKIARRLECEFGHKLTIGKHNRTVIQQLQQEGHEDVVRWMQTGRAHEAERPVAQKTPNDHQQEKRTKIAVERVQEDLHAAWNKSDSGRAFTAAIAEKGYRLARGDRRDFVVIDAAGGTHSPRRRLGVKAKDIRERWSDLDPNDLPSVEQIHQERSHRPPKIDTTNPDEALRQLQERKAETDREIEKLEAVKRQIERAGTGKHPTRQPSQRKDNTARFQSVAAEAVYGTQNDRRGRGEGETRRRGELPGSSAQPEEFQAPDLSRGDEKIDLEFASPNCSDGVSPRPQVSPSPSPSVSPSPSPSVSPSPNSPVSPSKDHDQRRQIEIMKHWQKSAEPERRKPQEGSLAWSEAESWGISQTTLEVMKTYTGARASAERDKRIAAAVAAEDSNADPNAASAYRTSLGQRLREKGRRYYRAADRWLTERLARLGYSKTDARQTLATASPELMDKQPGERVSYIRRLIDRVYREVEHAAPEMPEKKTARLATEKPSGKPSEVSRPAQDAKPQSPPPPSDNPSPKPSRKPRR